MHKEKMNYEIAHDLQARMCEIIRKLNMAHIDCNRVVCIRGRGSKTRRTIARCHALPKVMQLAMEVKAFYVIEFLDRFEKMSDAEKDMVIIHELLHIPKTFGGGFRHHDYVSAKNVREMYNSFMHLCKVQRGQVLRFSFCYGRDI